MKTEKWTVYKHTSPSGKVYIGITKQKAEYRWRKGKGYDSNTRFRKAIAKYGWDNFTHEILFSGLTQEEAEAQEKRLVREYKSTDKKYGYNVAEGGHALTKESREKIGNTRRERHIPPWTTGKHLSEETRRKISASNMGNRKHTEWTTEQREKMSRERMGEGNPNYGKPMDSKLKEILTAMNSKAVVQIGESGRTVFKSSADAQRITGIASCNIVRVCRGQRETAGGYKWEYVQ